jgi:hypothetical protein
MSEQLAATSMLTPAQYERSKTRVQRGEDIAYTINHALSCGMTDIFIQPYVNAGVNEAIDGGRVPRWLGWVKNIFEKHDHGHDQHDHHGHDHHHAHDEKPTLHANARHWLFGEAIADTVAVPLTVMTQRLLPGFMDGIRRVLEPMAGWAFRAGAQRDALAWARKETMVPDAGQIKAHEDALYEYEIAHLPQAVMWNAFSIPINIGMQWAQGSHSKWYSLLAAKTFGSLVSNGLLIGGRAFSPDTFHHIDQWNSKHIITPVARTVGGAFGYDKETMEQASRTLQATERQYHDRIQPDHTPAADRSLGD